MNHPQSPQKPSTTNGIVRRRMDKDGLSRSDNLNWRQPARTPSNSSLQGWNKGIHGRLFYMHTCLIGQHVEVQKVDGHVYSGILHQAIMDNEHGVMLKMARLIKEGTHCIQGDSVRQAARKPPIKTYVISTKDLVQIVAKDVSLSGDALANSRVRENRSELATDAVVSQGWQREAERELKPWKPDDEFSDPTSINLSNTWRSRNWDQFEANKALFGVETTFDEELYTTKLVRGPQLREREREAQRIALEIVGQQTRNVHLAEERGVQLAPELEAMDEETKYSSVGRDYEDVSDDDDDQHMNDRNDETFGGSVAPICGSTFQNISSSAPLSDGDETSLSSAEPQIVSGNLSAENYRERQDLSQVKEDGGSPDSSSDSQKEHLRLRKLLVGDKSKYCNKGSGSPYNSPIGRGSPLLSPLAGDPAGIKALNLDPSCPQVPDEVYREFKEFKQQKQLEALKALSESFKKELEPRSPGISDKITKGLTGDEPKQRIVLLDCTPNLASIAATPLPPVSASKKSPLNANAKDFKLNPNAQSFTPSSCSTRPTTPVAQHPLVAQSPVYMHSIVHGGTVIQGPPVNLQTMAQQNQLSPYNPAVASAVVAVNSTAYMSSPGGPVPGFPVGGVGGGGILPGQPNSRAPPHSQQQAMSSYGHPQQIKYHPPSSALQAGLLHPNGQLYPPHMMYGQPANPVVYMPFPQGMMQGHSVPSLGQGRLPQQNQPQSR